MFINNPTYYGICSNLMALTETAHRHGIKVLCDEAHGTHLYFGDHLPMAGMRAGVDMAAVSMHKSGGSLTQSSVLLTGPDMDPGHVRQIINLTQTTSASYLLLASLDLSRRKSGPPGPGELRQGGQNGRVRPGGDQPQSAATTPTARSSSTAPASTTSTSPSSASIPRIWASPVSRSMT